MVKKVKHAVDYMKNRTADVINRTSDPTIMQDHWQVNRNITPEGDNSGWGAFLPRKGRNRPTPHTKLNEVDH